MVVRIQLRHDTAQNWTNANPILLSGEVGIETDTDRLKIGTGNRWNDTNYYDKQYVHTQGAEEIYGEKTFRDDIKVGIDDTIEGRANVDIFGNLTVSGEIDGVAYRAYEDGEGNNIIDTYQKKITGNDTVVDGVNWNTLTSEGTYGVAMSIWNPNEWNDPSTYDQQIGSTLGKIGMLVVHEDKDGRIVQRYMPMTSTGNNTVVTRYRNVSGTWSNWFSFTYYDSTVVHTSKDENIDGVKVFNQVLKSSNGAINLSEGINSQDSGTSAKIQRAGSTFIRRETNGELYISSNNTNIYIRPNGDNNNENQLVISNEGVLDGKCLKDSEGRVIVDTYATYDSLQAMSLKVPSFVDKTVDENSYQHIVDKTQESFGNFVDILKADKYTVQGTPTIQNGILSNISSANYATANVPDLTTGQLYIIGSFKTGTDLTENQYVYYYDSNNYLYINGTLIESKTNGIALSTTFNFTTNTKYTYAIDINSEIAKLYINNDLLTQMSVSSPSFNISTIVAKFGTDGTTYFKGEIDLNDFQIAIDGDILHPVYQPCLVIPYVLSKDGTKVTSGEYEGRITNCYSQYHTGNYFVLDEVNNKFRLPYDSPNGLAHTLYNYRNGNIHCEYDTNLECTQTGICTNGTAVTFNKPFADNNYILIGVSYSNKTATGFTPTTDGQYIAKGRITLG